MREISLFWRVAIVFYLDDGGEERAKRGEEDTGQLQHVSVLPDYVPATNNLYCFLCTSVLISSVPCGSLLQGESKKSGISKIMGISSFKYIRKGHIGGVLENSGYLLPDGH